MLNKVLYPGAQAASQPLQPSRLPSRLQKGMLAAIAFTLSGLLPIALIQFQKNAIRAAAAQAQQQLTRDPVTGLVLAIQTVGKNGDRLPGNLLPEVQSSLLTAIQTARERNRFQQPYPVHTIAFSPDAQTIATAGANGDLYLWNRQGQHRSLPGKQQPIRSLSFSPDASQVIGLPEPATPGRVQRWDLKQNAVDLLPVESPSSVTVAAFSDDNAAILSGSVDGKVRLWNRQQQWIGQLNPAHNGSVTGVASAGGTIASSGTDGKIFLWNPKGDLVGQLWAGASIRAMRLDQAGQRIITEDVHHQQTFLWNSQANQWQQYVLGTAQQVRSVDLNPSNTIVAQGLANGTLHLGALTPQNQFAAQTLIGHSGSVNTVRFSPDGRTLTSGAEDGSIRMWDVFDGTLLTRLHGQEWIQGNLKTIALSPNGRQVAITEVSGKIYLRDIQEKTIAPLGETAPDQSTKIIFSSDSKTIAQQTKNHQEKTQIRLWRDDGQALAKFSIPAQDTIQTFAVNPDGTQIISLSPTNKLQLWNTQGELIAQSNAAQTFAQPPAQFLILSPDGRQLITGSTTPAQSPAQSPGQICLWSLQSGIKLQSCRSISSQAAQFSPDGQRVAIGSSDGKVYLWNLKTQQMTDSSIVHPKGVTAIAFSSDGKTIASGSTDGSIRLLDIQLQPIGHPFIGHQTPIQAIAFNPDGQTLTSLSQDGEIRLWRAHWQAWLKTACDRLQNHPVFTASISSIAKEAKATCQRWVWSTAQAPSPTPSPAPSVASQPIRLVVRLGERRVYVYRGSNVEASYPVAVGRSGWETPTGNFRIFEMLRDPGWTHPFTNTVVAPGAGNPLGSRWIAFWTDGYNAAGFHGTPDRSSVGQAASHGCLRMRDEDVRALYEWVKLGTPVTVEP